MICLFLGAVLCGGTAAAQHTLGVTGGYGYGNARFYPDQETRAVWGCYTAGVTWRYYGPQRFVGGFGIDFEYLQRGFSFLQNPTEEDPAKYQWYTRRVKSLMLPIVWQPHIYLFKNRMRVYLDAAVFFSYNISSTFINEQGSTVSPEQSKGPWRGEYDFKVVRDNRWFGCVTTSAIRTCCAITTSMREIRRTATKIHSILPPSDPRSIT